MSGGPKVNRTRVRSSIETSIGACGRRREQVGVFVVARVAWLVEVKGGLLCGWI